MTLETSKPPSVMLAPGLATPPSPPKTVPQAGEQVFQRQKYREHPIQTTAGM